MEEKIQKILSSYTKNNSNIYLGKVSSNDQAKELELREKVAIENKFDLDQVAKHHSIEVMDNEVKNFILPLKQNSIVLDVGCGWCWHWRKIKKLRSDITIFALDFAQSNFKIAKEIFDGDSKSKIYFINENILQTNLPYNFFDAIWSCQTYQHIPNLPKAFEISYNLLKPKGLFCNYNLNYSIFSKVKNLFKKNKRIHMQNYYLNKDIEYNCKLLEKIFKNKISKKYCEILFHPEFYFKFGRENSIIGKLDSKLSGTGLLHSFFGRQVLIKTSKL